MLALFLRLHGVAHAAETLSAIRFAGNETTRPVIMLQEMSIAVGDPVDPKRIEQSRQAIMDLGLFKSVRAELLDGEQGKELLITVDEKFYILPFPLLDIRPEGDYSYGMEVRFDNLAGLNQRLKLSVESKDSIDEDVHLRREAKLDYTYPRLVGTPYELSVGAKLAREDFSEEVDGERTKYLHESRGGSFFFSRWMLKQGPRQGWRIGAGMRLQQEFYERILGGPGTYGNSQAVGLTGGLGYVAVHEYPYHREGMAAGYGVEVGFDELGSDYNYTHQSLLLRNYLPIALDKRTANLNLRARLSWTNGQPFNKDVYELGGADSLRGYEHEYVTGNALALINLEYHHPVSGYPQLRGVVFADAGNVYADADALDLGRLNKAVGVGLRWKVQSFVNLTLRLDLAYGIDAETEFVYATTSGTF